jgi:predicted tellurium resistance membrane protein TerC
MKIFSTLLFIPISWLISYLAVNYLAKTYNWLLTSIYPSTHIIVLVIGMIISVVIFGLLATILSSISFQKYPILSIYSITVVIILNIYLTYNSQIPSNAIYMIVGFTVYYAFSVNNSYKVNHIQKGL